MVNTLRPRPTLPPRIAANPYARAVAVCSGVQLLGIGVLALLSAWHGEPLASQLAAWDGQWYLQIAKNGYGGVSGQYPSFPEASLAFFPLYPMLIWIVAMLPGIGYLAAGVVLSLASSAVAACGLVRLARQVDARPVVGLLLVALWAGAPMAITLSMVYTEALFCAFAVWALVGLLEREWWLAATCCLYAGLVRSTSSVLIGVVVLAALRTVWSGSGRERGQAAACATLAPLGLLGYWAYVAIRTGSVTGWAEIQQRGWGMGWDFGVETAEWFVDTLATGSSVMMFGAALLIVASLVLVALCVRRLPWPLTAYGAGVVLLVIGTGGLPNTKPRLLLVAVFVLAVPLAVGLANRTRPAMFGGLAALIGLGTWYSAYSLTAWQFAI